MAWSSALSYQWLIRIDGQWHEVVILGRTIVTTVDTDRPVPGTYLCLHPLVRPTPTVTPHVGMGVVCISHTPSMPLPHLRL